MNYPKLMLKYKNYIFISLLILLAIKVFVPQLDALYDSIAALKGADLVWVLCGTIVFFLGMPILTIQLMAQALKPLPFGLTFKVEMAGLFVTKLLPSAVGSLSLNIYYFIKQGHTASQATAVMAMDTLTSTIAYTALIILALFSSDLSLEGISNADIIPDNLLYFIVILLLGSAYLLYRSPSIRAKVAASWHDLKKNFASYKNRPMAVVWGVVCNFFGSVTTLFALYASAHAVGIDLSLAAALLAYTFGNIAATLIPTPGGIGSTEAGLYSGLVVVGVDGANALVITMLYRLITYWLPILPGYYYFWGLRKTVLSQFSIKKSDQDYGYI